MTLTALSASKLTASKHWREASVTWLKRVRN